MFCPKCGYNNTSEAVFCGKCGYKLPVLNDIGDTKRSNITSNSSERSSNVRAILNEADALDKEYAKTQQQRVQNLLDKTTVQPARQVVRQQPRQISFPTVSPVPQAYYPNQGRICPRCGGVMTIQTVAEKKKAGCFTYFWYILLALTILGLFIVIPLMLRSTVTVSYAVCQNCGYRERI